jgi:site-specific DNA-methyltransferase (adenine-specific)
VTSIRLLCGDALEQLRLLPENSVDAVVTDPPYGLSFMGKDWDHGIPGEVFWREALRVAKPGAHLLAFGGTRTFHRLACAIEDAGWEIRDCLMWVYGSGFPKSLDVSKAIDKVAGAERPVIHKRKKLDSYGVANAIFGGGPDHGGEQEITEAATEAAHHWEGWGTGLKPAWEPIILARKPLEGTVAENVQKWGTGALNIDGCRVPGEVPSVPQPKFNSPTGQTYGMKTGEGRNGEMSQASGRWPANLIHDGSEEVVGMFPQVNNQTGDGFKGGGFVGANMPIGYADSGSAARFFYCAKASKEDRDEGLYTEADYEHSGPRGHSLNGDGTPRPRPRPRGNNHPTVKPTNLMRYLCRLVTPPGGMVLDPFMGSGSTGKAAVLEGFSFIGIDNVPQYVEIARRRIEGTAPLFVER